MNGLSSSRFGLSSSGVTQAFTGAVPFNNSLPVAAMLAVMSGKRPSQPTHPALTDQLWTLMQRFWNQDPRLRPDVSEALQLLSTSSVYHSFRRSSFMNLTVFSRIAIFPPGNG